MKLHHGDERTTLWHGDCLEVLRELADNSVDSVVCDPPYGLEFMGKAWDSFSDGTASSRAVAGMSGTGYTDGAERLERPSFMGGTNPKCRTCDRWQRGGNPCHCEAPDFPNERRARSAAFGEWCELWTVECLRVLKPGGHLLAFGGSRTWHRLAVAVEDAGFEIRDSIAWLYGSGFPKSLDVSKAIDKAAGAERPVVGINPRAAQQTAKADATSLGAFAGTSPNLTAPATPAAEQWQGWGTALKPAFEPVVVGRKPLVGTVAANVLAYGTGALNIDGCRVGLRADEDAAALTARSGGVRGFADHYVGGTAKGAPPTDMSKGRWPANVVLDESQAAALDEQSGTLTSGKMKPTHTTAGVGGRASAYGKDAAGGFTTMETYGDKGGASRFFYVAKAPKSERPRTDDGTAHPTVKPLALMRWLVRLVTPPGGTVLEPFAGSGTTVEACLLEGFNVIAIEREADYLPLIEARIARVQARPAEDMGLLAFLDDDEAAS